MKNNEGLNVLSLFDGMSCGQIALDKLGIKVDNYFASEIDKPAMKVSDKNYPNIKQLGSIIDLTEEQLISLGPIDLLIGGSPCQGFSVAGKMKGSQTKEGIDVISLEQYLDLKSQGFEFDGQSYLFWEYVRVWKIIKPKYFFLENVRVTKKWLPMFNEAMGVDPIMINSRLVSAQNRVRYYWTNIPGVTQPEDKGIVLSDILEDNVDKKYNAGEALQKGYKGGNQLNPKYKSQANTIHNGEKSGTICAGTHGYANGYVAEPKALCGASRGRYLVDGKHQDGKMKTAGLTQQMLEIRPDEKTNCLTTVGKDNLVVIGLNHGDRVPILEVKEATKKGYIEVENGNCFDYSVPNSKTRRGRSMNEKSNALLTSNQFMRYEFPTYRKFTPIECERLQTVPDNYTECVSDSQRYRMLGNGWTVDVIAHIFSFIPEIDSKSISVTEELKSNYPDLVESYSKMNKDQLLEQICLEVLDLHKMEERVSTFMSECTDNMSNTNYTIDALKTLINQRKENDISNFCFDLLEDYEDEDIIKIIKKEASKNN